ncbi:RNA-directed DNA polymerase [Bifidobacterium tibiigranuli]|jgi:hypothetical protein|uniref:RNA-directed DNA polymerase n=1 Tax=Bifidobacterium tibiigranuli TaxID=2172043 RepID=UPI002352AB04|nr:RNA-directed DNA polymerase [Bifidobacterium tibiigranuli]MCH3973669.1 RNA-directed DNA polymerase [Bifidobacterium tibiigranuli]
MPVISDASFSKAVHVIAVHGDTDIFPYPFDDFVMYDVPDKVVAALKETEVSLSHASGGAKYDQYFEQHPVNHYSTLSPVSQTGFRWATQLDPFWNAYLLAAVIEIAPDIEAARLPRDQKQVFAYRYNNESTNQLYLESAWRQFQEETRKRSESDSCKYVVTADISDFYPRIYHHRLENSLKTAAPEKPDVIRTIMSILFRIAQNQSYGLPVGSDASRLLAECALDKVDHLLATNDDTQQFCRYVDDYRFFVESEEQAYRAIAYLSEKLQLNEGLSLQKSKTRIMSVKEYQTMLEPPRPVSGSAADFMSMHIHYDPYSSTADADYEEIKKKLSDFNIADLLNKELDKSQIHVSLTKKLIGILKLLDSEEQARIIETLLDNIDQLIPVVPQVMKAVKQATSNMDKDVSASVQSRIRNLIIENRPIAQIDLNRAYMIRVLGTQHSQENEQLLIKLYSEDSPVIIKRDIMLIMANWGASYWVSDRKNYLGQEDKWVQRAFFLASYALGDEGRHWRQHKETSGYDKVISEWAALKRSKLGAKWVIPL